MKLQGSAHWLQRVFQTWAPWALALTLVTVFLPTIAWAQVNGSTGFTLAGRIQRFVVNNPADILSGGTVTINDIPVIIPRNTIVTVPVPGNFLTWTQILDFGLIFNGTLESGLAVLDPRPPISPYELTIEGNIVNGTYIAGLVTLQQAFVQALMGPINFIDYTTGELRVGGPPGVPRGTRVKLNDPVGVFGRVTSVDDRFASDPVNQSILARSGYPMCIPRFNPAVRRDPDCPSTNRPLGPGKAPLKIFTMAAPGTGGATTDPTKQAPLMIGDFINYIGVQAVDARGAYIAASLLEAFVQINTAPGTLPAYVSQVDGMFGVGGAAATPGVPVEQHFITRIRGFTTDRTQPVDVFAIDVNACTGAETERLLGTAFPDPITARFVFDPLVSVTLNKLPPTREYLVRLRSGVQLLPNGMPAGQFRSPLVSGHIFFPETLIPGGPVVPRNFQDFPFLKNGTGPLNGTGPVVGQLSPWPGVPTPTPTCP